MTRRRTGQGGGSCASLDAFVKKVVLLLGVWVFAAATACAVILFSTNDPSANTTAPTGNLADSGWQYQGSWGAYLGTPIAPQFFISASHIGNAGNSIFIYQNVNYPVVSSVKDPFSDLQIWQVSATQTFPSFAPLYTKQDEVGKQLVVMGRGTQRGNGFTLNGTLLGWIWGQSDSVKRWGENIVTSIVPYPGLHELIYATFDQDGLPSEAHLSSGDSGGAVFLQDNGVWKLAGINYGVDSGFDTDSGGMNPLPGDGQALFDTRGLYYEDTMDPPHYALISGSDPVPTGFYSTRISSSLDWIYSVIDPTGDFDGDGIPNLLEYALILNAPGERGYGATQASISSGMLSLTYRKITTATQLQYEVRESTDLVSWTTVTPQVEVVETDGNVQTIKASVPVGSNTPLFLRLRITQQ
jgi:hypothetical protein